jgi:hypothetical protein
MAVPVVSVAVTMPMPVSVPMTVTVAMPMVVFMVMLVRMFMVMVVMMFLLDLFLGVVSCGRTERAAVLIVVDVKASRASLTSRSRLVHILWRGWAR